VPFVATAQVPLPQTHWPFTQQAAFLPCFAQQAPSGQQSALEALFPHENCPVAQSARPFGDAGIVAPTTAAPAGMAARYAAGAPPPLWLLPGGQIEQPLGQAPPVDEAHVPLLHTHCPVGQHAAALPCFAQQVFGGQQIEFAFPFPHE
jgi:hypothetical protein